jgi:hypothetical protein
MSTWVNLAWAGVAARTHDGRLIVVQIRPGTGLVSVVPGAGGPQVTAIVAGALIDAEPWSTWPTSAPAPVGQVAGQLMLGDESER